MSSTHRSPARPPLAATPPRLALLLALALAATGARAQTPPGFLVERIVVEGVERDAARRIVVSESLLREGHTYSEAELREAVYRVKRLPFVVDADMALHKGSERGAYELAIVVESAKPIAVAVEVQGFGRNPHDTFGRRARFDWQADGAVSARRFVGPRGLLFGSVQESDYSGGQIVQLGYTQYGLLRPGGYASVAISSQLGAHDRADDFQASVQLGMPVVGNHAVRASLARTQSNSVQSLEGHRLDFHDDSWDSRLEWVYDSTDDPLVPGEGTRLVAAGAYGEHRFERTGRFQPLDVLIDTNIDYWQLRGDGRRYWRLTPRQSVAVGSTVWRQHREPAFGTTELTEDLVLVEAIHAASLWGFEKSRRFGDLRWENGVGAESFRETQENHGELPFRGTQKEAFLALRSSLLFRNAWGLVRLSATYVDSIGEGW